MYIIRTRLHFCTYHLDLYFQRRFVLSLNQSQPRIVHCNDIFAGSRKNEEFLPEVPPRSCFIQISLVVSGQSEPRTAIDFCWIKRK